MNKATGTETSNNQKRNSKQKYNGEEISIKIERNRKQEEYHIKPTEIKNKIQESI